MKVVPQLKNLPWSSSLSSLLVLSIISLSLWASKTNKVLIFQKGKQCFLELSKNRAKILEVTRKAERAVVPPHYLEILTKPRTGKLPTISILRIYRWGARSPSRSEPVNPRPLPKWTTPTAPYFFPRFHTGLELVHTHCPCFQWKDSRHGSSSVLIALLYSELKAYRAHPLPFILPVSPCWRDEYSSTTLPQCLYRKGQSWQTH